MMTVIRYEYREADTAGESGHAQRVMQDFCTKNGVRIEEWEASSVGDCWLFRVVGEDLDLVHWPSYMVDIGNLDRKLSGGRRASK